MKLPLEISDVAIVLVGSLNPPIFHPQWFAGNGLIEQKEAEAAEIEVIHKEISIFRMDWLAIKVDQQRFVAEIFEAPYIRASDLLVRTFKEFLIHTPITMLGINRRVHFTVGDEEKRNKIGKALAPHDPWGKWGAEIEGSSKENRGGLRSLTMEQRDLADRKKGYVRCKIEPSKKVDPQGGGIYMEVNDHYEVEEQGKLSGCQEMINTLESNFDKSINHSEFIINQIMSF